MGQAVLQDRERAGGGAVGFREVSLSEEQVSTQPPHLRRGRVHLLGRFPACFCAAAALPGLRAWQQGRGVHRGMQSLETIVLTNRLAG